MIHAPYIVLRPGQTTNPGKKHAVVHVEEWVAVFLKEKATYTFRNEHDDYDSAAAERTWLNQQKPKDIIMSEVTDEEEITV